MDRNQISTETIFVLIRLYGAKLYGSLRAARFILICRDPYRYISFPFLTLNSLCDVQKTDAH